MKRSDVDTLHHDGMISEAQHAAIVARYALDAPGGSRLGGIFAMIGAAIAIAGVALVISANWAAIPRLVKIAAAVVLLIALHAGGWSVRTRNYPRIAAALHIAGSVMFLLCIALLGQVYNLSSRPPNAILLWTLGIAALPWLLQSRAQFVLLLVAAMVWLLMEADTTDSWFYLQGDFGFFAPVVWAWIGALLLAVAMLLRVLSAGSRALRFDTTAEWWGLALLGVALLICVAGYNAAGIGRFEKSHAHWMNYAPFWMSVLAVGIAAAFSFMSRVPDTADASAHGTLLRAAWAALLVAAVLLPWWIALSPYVFHAERWQRGTPLTWGASALLLALSLVQIQRGVARGSRALVNLGLAFVALNIAVAYAQLFGSMMNTGITFVVTGVLLVLLSWFLERWRRRLTARMNAATAGSRMTEANHV
ncbi:MAG: DUF2157 domain-containing protein [Burkholderiales bacterium]|nr:DUF2157 domain-containing protein [Burkholderiales bacterium]